MICIEISLDSTHASRVPVIRPRQIGLKPGWGNVLAWVLLLLLRCVAGRADHMEHPVRCIVQGVSVGTGIKLAARSVNDLKSECTRDQSTNAKGVHAKTRI